MSVLVRSLWSRKRRLFATTAAVVAGVSFLTATLVLGDTTRAGFADTFATANAGTDVVVRSATRIGGAGERVAGVLPADLVDLVASLDGVAAVAPEVRGIAQLVGTDGTPVGGDGPPTFATNWIDDSHLSPLAIVAGRPPQPVTGTAPVEVVIDEGAADEAGLAVGDTTTVLTPTRVPVVVTGLARFGGASLGGATFVVFDTATAQRLVAGDRDVVSAVLVRGDGRPAGELARSIGARLPAGVEAITGAQLTAEQRQDVDDSFLGMFRALLLAFAGVAVVVAVFSIHNTFTILVVQRTRESALLRAVGGSRRQVLGGVLVEALTVGTLGTAVGLAAGIGIAAALQAAMEANLGLPGADLVIGATTVIVPVAVGVGTTLVAGLGPALKASRVAPLAALRDVAVDRSGFSFTRLLVGAGSLALGVVGLVTAGSAGDAALARAGLGALGLIAGAVVAGPVVARPVAATLGLVPASIGGVSGRLARRNAMRNPRRTAASASALMVGTAVVALFTTFGASLKASLDQTVDTDFVGDLIVLPEGFSGSLLAPALPAAIAEVPGVVSAVGTAYGPALIDGATADLAGTDVASLDTVFDVGVVGGSLAGFGDDDIAVSRHYAQAHDIGVGSDIAVGWVDGTAARLEVAAVYEDRMTFGDLVVTTAQLTGHLAQPSLTVILVDVAPGRDGATVADAVREVTRRFGAPDPMDAEQYKDSIGAEVDGMLFVVYGLLAVAVVIALGSIGNTLSLSIHERTRELGLLRAVGQDRAGVRAGVRWEAVIVAVFGAAGGIGLGAFAGWGLMRAMVAQEGFGTFTLPVVPLAAVVVLAAAAGLVASFRPSRRAARTDILAAIGEA